MKTGMKSGMNPINAPIHAVAQQFVDNQEFSGIEWEIKRHGKTVDEGAVGYASLDDRTPIPEQAIYRIYSMTKPIVSVAALILLQEQKLRLYDPLMKYIPGFATQKILQPDGTLVENPSPITLEHLLTHRAGLSYDFLPDCPVAELYRQAQLAENSTSTLEDFTDQLAQLPIAYVPGTEWRYSFATDVLARVVELVSDQPIDEFLKARVLLPLGMTDTDYSVPDTERHRLMPMYGARSLSEMMAAPVAKQTLQTTDAEPSYPSQPNTVFRRGGHGLFSTTRDYMLFCEFMQQGTASTGETLLGQTLFNMMWANRLPAAQLPLAIGPQIYPGYGWNLCGRVMLDIGQSLLPTSHGEGGWGGAASTYYWIDRARSVSGVVMTQYMGASLPIGGDMQSAAYALLDRLESDASAKL